MQATKKPDKAIKNNNLIDSKQIIMNLYYLVKHIRIKNNTFGDGSIKLTHEKKKDGFLNILLTFYGKPTKKRVNGQV